MISCTRSSTQMMLCFPRTCNGRGSSWPKSREKNYSRNQQKAPNYLLNDWVVSQCNSLLVNFPITPLVYQFFDTLQIGVPESKWAQTIMIRTSKTLPSKHILLWYSPISHIRLNPAKHVHCSLVNLKEYTIEDLQFKRTQREIKSKETGQPRIPSCTHILQKENFWYKVLSLWFWAKLGDKHHKILY